MSIGEGVMTLHERRGRILDEVEDQFSGIPKNPNPGVDQNHAHAENGGYQKDEVLLMIIALQKYVPHLPDT